MLIIVICFTLPLIIQMFGYFIYPPDFSGEFPLYSPDFVLLVEFALSINLIGVTIMGMKAEEERNILTAAGFTALAISMGLAGAGLFEITTVANVETYEKFYYITVASNFLYIPSLLLIANYDKFKLWIRVSGFVASLPLLLSTILFMAKYRDFTVLETINNTGYSLLGFLQLLWAGNMYVNYKNETKATV